MGLYLINAATDAKRQARLGMTEEPRTGAVRRLSVSLALVIPAKAGISLFKEDCLTAVLFFYCGGGESLPLVRTARASLLSSPTPRGEPLRPLCRHFPQFLHYGVVHLRAFDLHNGRDFVAAIFARRPAMEQFFAWRPVIQE